MLRVVLFVSSLLLGSSLPLVGSLLTIESRQQTFAVICKNGFPLCAGGTESQVDQASVDGTAHSNNSDGNLSTPSEARTAARSGPVEIAANASIVHRTERPFEAYSDVFGDSLFEWDVLVLNEGDVYFTFNLPPGFVEIQSNAEFRDMITLTAAIQADIQYCTPACVYSPANPSLFQMAAQLDGGYDTYTLFNNAVSVNPALDTAALTHDNVTSSGAGFIRTWTWQYDAFTGQINLGHFVAGQTFTLSYRLLAEVYSRWAVNQMPVGEFQTWAAAAINDPFFLSSDPLPVQSIGRLEFVPSAAAPIPEPAVGGLIAAGLAVLAATRILRRKRV
jgi:hypothetical protein